MINHNFTFIFPGYVMNQFNDHLPVSLLAQLIERCTGITEVRVRFPASLIFFRLSSRNCISCVFNCDGLLYSVANHWLPVKVKSLPFLLSSSSFSCWREKIQSLTPSTELNRPFPSFPGTLLQNEGRCAAFDMEIIFHSHVNKTHFHKKGCAPSLMLKVRVFGTRKWPIAENEYDIFQKLKQHGHFTC